MNSKLDLNAMLTFCKVAENSSFTSAADSLGVKKSTVSNKVAELEQALGAKLLYRNTRHVALTEIGTDYFRYCKEIVSKAEEANQFVNTFNTEPQGMLRIISPPGLSRILFDDLFGKFLKQYEKISIDVNLTLDYVDIIKEGFDVAIIVSNSRLKDSSLIAKKLFEVDMGFFASPEYLKNNKAITSLIELEEHPFIQSSARQISVYQDGKTHHISLTHRILINYLDACIKAVEMDLGIGFLPSSSVTKELENGTLVRVLPEFQIMPSTLYAVYHSRSWLPPKLKIFLEFLDEWRSKYTNYAPLE